MELKEIRCEMWWWFGGMMNCDKKTESKIALLITCVIIYQTVMMKVNVHNSCGRCIYWKWNDKLNCLDKVGRYTNVLHCYFQAK